MLQKFFNPVVCFAKFALDVHTTEDNVFDRFEVL